MRQGVLQNKEKNVTVRVKGISVYQDKWEHMR